MVRFGGNETGIGDITVDKGELIGTLELNRAKHHEVFVAAKERFKVQARQKLEAVLQVIDRGEIPEYVGARLPIPEEHLDDYDRAIGMLRRHVGSTIELSESAYAQLVDDDWGWGASFNANTTSYLATGR